MQDQPKHGSSKKENESEVFRLISRTLEILYPVTVLGLVPTAANPFALLLAASLVQITNSIISRVDMSPRLSSLIRIPINLVGLALAIFFYGPQGFGWLLGLPLVVGGSALTPSRWQSPSPQRSGGIFTLVSSTLVASIQIAVGTPIEAAAAGLAGCIFTGIISIRVVAEFRTKNRQLSDEHNANIMARAAMERRNQMSIIGTMTAKLAHDINNPLTYVTMNIDLVKMELEELPLLNPNLLLALESAETGAAQITKSISDLRSFFHSEKREVVSLDIGEVGKRSAQFFEQAHPATPLRVQIKPVPLIMGEPHRMLQAILNLLINASDAVSERHAQGASGEVVLRIQPDPSTNAIIVEVEDNGAGISEAIGETVFDPFVTTKQSKGGMGLGLAIVRTIVQEHRGKISMTSDEGGTTFRIALPLAAQSPFKAPRRVTETTGNLKDLTILVIDDEASIRETIRRMLPYSKVVLAENGKEALELLDSQDIDLILCDVIMPVLGGFDVYEEIIENHPELIRGFALMTGGLFTPKIEDYLSKIEAPCLLKPFNRQQLITLLTSLGAKVMTAPAPPGIA